MRKAEKIFFGVYITLFLFMALGIKGFSVWFFLVTILVSLFYVVSSYWVFNNKENPAVFIPIISGIGIASALLAIDYNIRMRQEDFFQIYLPLVAILSASYLILNYIFVKKSGDIPDQFKIKLLLRLIPLTLLSSCLAFGSHHSSFYRSILITLNSDHDDLISNLKMFEYAEEANKMLDVGRCDKALDFSLKSLQEGKNWLSMYSDNYSQKDYRQLWKLNSIYSKIYRSLDCLSEQARDNEEYALALDYQKKADSVINIHPYEKNMDTHKQRANSKNDIAICYEYLENYDSAFHYYSEAIKYYIDSVGMSDSRLATMFTNFGLALRKNDLTNESTNFFKTALRIYENDSLIESISKQAYLHLKIARNEIDLRKISAAKKSLRDYSAIKSIDNSCLYKLYSSIINLHEYNYDSVEIWARMAKLCYQEKFDSAYESIANSTLLIYESKMALANYDSAEHYLQKSFDEARKYMKIGSIEYGEYYKRIGDLQYQLGSYKKAEEKYFEVLNINLGNLVIDSEKLVESFTCLALAKVILGHKSESSKLVNKAKRIATSIGLFREETYVYLINDIAYSYYLNDRTELADSIYSVAMNLISEEKMGPDYATTLNGLGLVNMNLGMYDESDSLFDSAISVYKNYFAEDHPSIATVLMNKSEMFTSIGDYDKAEKLVSIGIDNFSKYYNQNHPVIGRAYLLKSLISWRQNNIDLAQTQIQQSIKILKLTYPEKHEVIKTAEQLSRQLKRSR